ncbi:MAG: aspartate/glutamate racemase family protein [Parvibaculum sp.]
MISTPGPELVFLHTSPAHIATFDALRDELAPDIRMGHVVREDLLAAVRKAGKVTTAVEFELVDAMNIAARMGVTRIMCTCSTLGGVAEAADVPGVKVMRIDRPMVREAARIGGRIAVCAALSETLDPTLALVQEELSRSGVSAAVSPHLFDGVWDAFTSGKVRDYYQGIANRLRDVAADADVVVLAQASMAPAADLVGAIGVPVLSSPRLGFMAATL